VLFGKGNNRKRAEHNTHAKQNGNNLYFHFSSAFLPIFGFIITYSYNNVQQINVGLEKVSALL
ncbi:MAG: hypothetical protein IKL41_07360, partial [Clostridia bacterium]|nr:hypothetical protein [Clostridia bacterium]